MNPPANITIINSTTNEYREQIMELWDECLPGTPSCRFDWLANGNPAGSTNWFLAIDKITNRVIGVSTITANVLCKQNEIKKGGILGDIMVSKPYQGKGIFTYIQKYIIANLPLLGLEFLYVVPNNKAKRRLKHIGYKKIFTLKNYLIPINVSSYMPKGLLTISRSKPIQTGIDSIFNNLYERSDFCEHKVEKLEHAIDNEIDLFFKEFIKETNHLAYPKNTSFLYWKYVHNPYKIEYYVLKTNHSDGLLSGYCVFAISEFKIHIYELASLTNNGYLQLLSLLRKFGKENKLSGIYFYTSANNPLMKTIRHRGLLRIGGDMSLLYFGHEKYKNVPWSFYAGDRNI